MGATTFDVGSELELNQAIASADAATSGSFDIVFTQGITEGTDVGQSITFGSQTLSAPPDLYALNLASGVSVTIDGGGDTLDGAGAYRGFFVYAGSVTINDLTIADAHAVGGEGGPAGGGGAGLGGGLFVAGTGNVDGAGNPLVSGGTVTLDAVTFSSDTATGGAGGGGSGDLGDGGGLGGPGGGESGGGGGIGSTATGGSFDSNGGPGIVLGAAAAGGGTTGQGGLFGGGGGPAAGGGIGGSPGSFLTGGAGGFGGGGGAAFLSGAAGGFGGGGAAEGNGDTGGGGGFGGGGGGGDVSRGGQGGFGGGQGGDAVIGNGKLRGGGGGLGAGGDIFVQQGGVLTVEGGSLSGGTVTGGSPGIVVGETGAGDATGGSGYASGIFLQGTAAITLAPLGGETLSLGDALADQNIAGGTEPAGTVVIDGPGGVVASGTADITVGDLQVVGTGLLQLQGVTVSTDPVTIDAGGDITGFGTVTGAVTNNNTITATGGTLELTGAMDGTGSLQITPGAELVLGGAVGSGQTIGFNGAGVLEAVPTVGMDGLIAGFVSGDTIYLPNVPFNSGADTLDFSGGVLTITDGVGTTLDTLDFSGSYATDDFRLAADPLGGTDLLPCFAAGTRIAAERGDIAVEELRVGEAVRTVSGAARPVAWIGQRLVECGRHPRPENVWPVRVLAGAFGDGLPARDLLLSPDHSLFVDGVLIPVRHLVNGTVVVQEKRDRVHYFHIELLRHDVLLAEGLPAESYLDTGNRHVFANGAVQMALHPEFEPLDWYDDAYAPLIVRGEKLAAARRELFAEAVRRGWRTAVEPDLHVRVDGRAIRAQVTRKLHRFALPAGACEVRIVSRAGVPAEIDPGSADRRRLGARIGAVFVDDDLVPLESAALEAGFHAPEGSGGERWRWTDGAALLRLPVPLPRPAFLELLVRDTMRHWQRPERRIAAAA